MKIGIIGGGASGLVTAIVAKTNNNDVTILERNSECGKKILATGNGRCNYWNTYQDLSCYNSDTIDKIKELINDNTEKEVLSFFKGIGIIPKIKNGYWYPMTNQAKTIKDALIEECLNKKVVIKNNYLVENIKFINNKFIINNELEFDKLVISTGSYASPKTGSDGMGYRFLKELNHNIIKPLPALVQLNTKKYDFLKTWKGIRCDVRVRQVEDGIEKNSETGEIQLTDYGVSGICIFNLSNDIARGLDNNKKEEVLIDFLPTVTDEELKELLSNNISIKNTLSKLINEVIVDILIKGNNINDNTNYNELIKCIRNFKVEIKSTKSFNEAQVSSGGVSLEDINLSTMESNKVKNLYVTGELLDITGICGGYNLGIAWRSAIVAGKSLRGDNNA